MIIQEIQDIFVQETAVGREGIAELDPPTLRGEGLGVFDPPSERIKLQERFSAIEADDGPIGEIGMKMIDRRDQRRKIQPVGPFRLVAIDAVEIAPVRQVDGQAGKDRA